MMNDGKTETCRVSFQNKFVWYIGESSWFYYRNTLVSLVAVSDTIKTAANDISPDWSLVVHFTRTWYLFTAFFPSFKFSPLFCIRIHLDCSYLGSFLSFVSCVRVNVDISRRPIASCTIYQIPRLHFTTEISPSRAAVRTFHATERAVCT